MFQASPAPMALIRNSSAASFITERRPTRSASRPAVMAPTAAPSSAEATAIPNDWSSIAKCIWIDFTAPLMTALS